MTEDLKELLNEYFEDYPDAQHPLQFTASFTYGQLVQILKNRRGKRINFYYIIGRDTALFEYL